MGGKSLQLLHFLKNCRGVPLSYVIKKYTPSLKDSENRDVEIIYQSSFFRNMVTKDPREIINILRELTLGNDAETWIKGLKCSRKEI